MTRSTASCAGCGWRTIVTPSTSRSCTRSMGRTACPSTCSTTWKGTVDRSPVRIGNAAVEQVQLDIYGELIQTAYTAWQSRKQLSRQRRAIVLQVVDYILEHWQLEDSGIWESRRPPRRYLYSQVLLWVGLDR